MSRSKIIEIARKKLGTEESPANSNKTKYGKWYGLDGHAWCAMFVSWVFDQAGTPLGKIQTSKGYHHCQGAHNYFRNEGRATNNPQKGDIVLFDWNNDNWADHTGIFVQWTNNAKTKFLCLEGNTSPSDNRNGGMVMERERRRESVKSFASPVVFEGFIEEESSGNLKIGDRGSEVVEAQKLLDDLGYPTMADGWYGAKTAESVKSFQKDNLMQVTGEVDLVTLGAMQEELSRREVAKKKLITGTFLKYGDSGFWVTKIQTALNEQGANPKLVVDGQFGRATKKAVIAFQSKKKLEADGIVGPQTFEALGVFEE